MNAVINPLVNGFLSPVALDVEDATPADELWKGSPVSLVQNTYMHMAGLTDPDTMSGEQQDRLTAIEEAMARAETNGKDDIDKWRLAMGYGGKTSRQFITHAGYIAQEYHAETGQTSITNWTNNVVALSRELVSRREFVDMEYSDFESNPAYEGFRGVFLQRTFGSRGHQNVRHYKLR